MAKKEKGEVKMDRRILAVTSVIFALVYMAVSSGSLCYAGLFSKEAKAVASGARSVKAVKKTVSPEELAARRQAMMEETQKALKAQEWTVYVSPRGGRGAIETDILTFTDETVTSKNLDAKGYPTSNFGMSVQDNGTVSWETMKTAATKDKAFLRGDLKGGVMTGVIFMKPVKGATSTYIFTTSKIQAEAAPVAVSAPAKKGKK